ncbi:hypothetical protein SBF1_5380004 [Candidatus Desulfosporosinus infrequens]|uniref:Uncharacterized protein n=1 Tax=Candidatus Desulfosporosinus infrequens TaxID=2043169 RepID=A0A2U3LJ47_9FIRM|nr:hypothetical protein SBF1_5380004 [Candidatus Desulfosporosinus infrequens]
MLKRHLKIQFIIGIIMKRPSISAEPKLCLCIPTLRGIGEFRADTPIHQDPILRHTIQSRRALPRRVYLIVVERVKKPPKAFGLKRFRDKLATSLSIQNKICHRIISNSYGSYTNSPYGISKRTTINTPPSSISTRTTVPLQ